VPSSSPCPQPRMVKEDAALDMVEVGTHVRRLESE